MRIETSRGYILVIGHQAMVVCGIHAVGKGAKGARKEGREGYVW
jgi:hypothetical protein